MTAQSSPAPDATGTVFEDGDTGVSRSYAEAIVNVAEKQGDVDGVLDDLDEIAFRLLPVQRTFAELMTSPLVSAADKDRLISKTFEGRAQPTVVRFLRVLNRHGRLSSLPGIARTARELWDRRQNRKSVTVRSASALDDGQQAALREQLARMLGATPVIRLEVDPSLIGGLVVQVGDDLYDASIRSRLEQLRQRLIEGKTHEIQSRRDHFSYSA